jgi:hypothetical protein
MLRATVLTRTARYFVLAAAAYWLPTVLGRRFGLSVGSADLLSGTVLVIGALAGTLLGGAIVDWGRRHGGTGDVASIVVGIVGFLVGADGIVVSLLAPMRVGIVPVFVPAFFVAVVGLYLYAGPYDAVGQNVVSPGLRASAITLQLLVAHLLGDSHATAAVGFLSDRTHSLQLALLVTLAPVLLVATAFAATALPTVRRDTERAEAGWAARGLDGAVGSDA